MDLHDQAVVEAHARHFGQHLGTKTFRVPCAEITVDDRGEQAFCGFDVQVLGCRGRMAVIGRGGAETDKVFTPEA